MEREGTHEVMWLGKGREGKVAREREREGAEEVFLTQPLSLPSDPLPALPPLVLRPTYEYTVKIMKSPAKTNWSSNGGSS